MYYITGERFRKRRQSGGGRSLPWILAGEPRQQRRERRWWNTDSRGGINNHLEEEEVPKEEEEEKADTPVEGKQNLGQNGGQRKREGGLAGGVVEGKDNRMKKSSIETGLREESNWRGSREKSYLDRKGRKSEKKQREEELDRAIEEMVAEEEATKDALLPDAALMEEWEKRGEGEEGVVEWWRDTDYMRVAREAGDSGELHPEPDWNEDQRNLLLELGLAVEWNEDHPLVEQNGDGEHGMVDDSAPVFMGLKLLPVAEDHFDLQRHEPPDIHQD